MKQTLQDFKRVTPMLFFTAAAAFVILFTYASCDTTVKNKVTKAVAVEKNDAKFNNKKEADAKFLVAVAGINSEEIELGKLAQTKGAFADVKELGKMMEEEHIKVMNHLKAFAPSKQITIPSTLTDSGKDSNKKLMDKNGKDFELAYCDMMVDVHKDAIAKLEKASTDAGDAELKVWSVSVLTSLSKHLNASITSREKCKKI